MKLAAGILLSSLLGLTAGRADLDPAAWHSSALPTSGVATNGWYFLPDAVKTPRILVKATGTTANVNRKLLTDGPPAWTAGAVQATSTLNKQGVFVPKTGGGGYLVAAHNTTLRMIEFDAGGSAAATEIIDNSVSVSAAGVSAALDGAGNLHVAYISTPGTAQEKICYGCRDALGDWTYASQDLSESTAPLIRQTAVVPSALKVANVYFTLDSGSTTSLLRVSTLQNGGFLFLANPFNFENFVADHIAGSRTGSSDRVFYFGTAGNVYKIHRMIGNTSAEMFASATEISPDDNGTVNPKSIFLATAPAPDNRQRIAWYDAAAKSIHYLKPTTAADGPPYTDGEPVVTTGGQTNADLSGFHFGPDNLPYLLYRRDLDEGFVAFPNDNFDFNNNGRLDILDTAFNSTTAGLEALPVKAATAGVANSADRFKFRFPTVGSAVTNSLSAVTSTQRNFRYGFELSPDGINWTPMTTAGGINFTQTAATGTNPNQVRTIVGVVPTVAPGTLPKRFARMVVTRPAYGY